MFSLHTCTSRIIAMTIAKQKNMASMLPIDMNIDGHTVNINPIPVYKIKHIIYYSNQKHSLLYLQMLQ